MSDPNFTDQTQSGDAPRAAGRLLALDVGARRVGIAVSDELRLTVRALDPVRRTNWKQLLRAVSELRERFDARGVVIGLPLRLDGSEGEAAREMRRLARKFELSLGVPIYLQDERLTSRAAEEDLRARGYRGPALFSRLDSEAAALILRDFLSP